MNIPNKGIPMDILQEKLDAYDQQDLSWHDGRTWGYVYDPGRKAEEAGKTAYMQFLQKNGLDFTIYPSIAQFEKDLVSMAASHLHGSNEVVGNFTSGGTESIMLAVKAARDYARANKPEILEPEMILPITGHAAFHKAAQYLNVKIVPVDVNPVTFRANPDLMQQAITKNTIMMVASSPSYAHGVIDPIEDLGKIASTHGIWFHVDGCVGGFLLPYFKRLGANIPKFDFSVEGVTSMSMDLHKYAYTPKGASLVMYRNSEYRKYQLFACADWPGYTVINSSVQSSKTGGPVAAAWTVVHFIGDDGYLEIAKRQYEGTKRLVEKIKQIQGLRLMAEPDLCMFSFTSDTISIFHIIDEMRERHWYIQPQFAFGPSKENIHLSVGASNVQWIEPFLLDLEASAKKASSMESGQYATAVKEALSGWTPDMSESDMLIQILSKAGIDFHSLPDRWAPVNEVLNALPLPLRNLALKEFLSEMFGPEQP